MINNLFYKHLFCLRFAKTGDHSIVNLAKTKSVNFSFSLHPLGSQRIGVRKTNVSSLKLFSSPSCTGANLPLPSPIFSFLPLLLVSSFLVPFCSAILSPEALTFLGKFKDFKSTDGHQWRS